MDDIFDDIEKTKREMDTFMDEMIGFSKMAMYGKTYFSPQVDIYEANNVFIIIVDVAGISKKDINLILSDGFIVIKGYRKRDHVHKQSICYYHMEIEYGPFERRIAIPRNCDVDNMKVVYKNGLLRIEIPLKVKIIKQIEIE